MSIGEKSKRLVRCCYSIPAAFMVSAYHLKRVLLGEEKAFLSLAERLSKHTGCAGLYLRAAVYSRVLADCSQEVQVGFGTVFSKPKAVIRDHVYIGRYCSLGWVHLEKHVMLADFVVVPSGGETHALRPGVPPRMMENKYSCVRLGEGTWVGSNALILADVGKHCIVGAGAVVTKPIPDHSVAVGVPAKVISTVGLAPVAAANSSE